MNHCNLLHKLILMPQAMKILDETAAVDKEWKKLEKIPAWQLVKVKSKKGGYSGGTPRQKGSSLCYIDGHISSKMRSFCRNFRSTKAGSCFEKISQKTTPEHTQHFTEQGSSASQMTAAKVMGVNARQPDCAGPAADAVSAYTRVKVKDASDFFRMPKSECPDIWIRLPRHKWPKSWSNIEDLVVCLERNLCGHPPASLVWDWDEKKYQTGSVFF